MPQRGKYSGPDLSSIGSLPRSIHPLSKEKASGGFHDDFIFNIWKTFINSGWFVLRAATSTRLLLLFILLWRKYSLFVGFTELNKINLRETMSLMAYKISGIEKWICCVFLLPGMKALRYFLSLFYLLHSSCKYWGILRKSAGILSWKI
jgi:hypothetical protein